jgi:hypothetical protein
MSSRTASSALSGSGHTCARHQTLNPGAALFRGKLDTRTWRRVQGLEPRGGGHTVSGVPPLQFTTWTGPLARITTHQPLGAVADWCSVASGQTSLHRCGRAGATSSCSLTMTRT